MIDSLIVLNNYFNDLFVSMVFLSALFIRVAARLGKNNQEAFALSLDVRGKLDAVFFYSLAFFFGGLIVRMWSMPEFELADAERNGQAFALKAKYAFLSLLVVAGVVLKFFDARNK